MLTLDIQKNSQNLSLELPIPIETLAGELRSIGINEPLTQIPRSDFPLQPTSALGEHFVKMLQPDDTLHSIAIACREFEALDGESRQRLVDHVMTDHFRDLDHVADYLQYGPDALEGLIRLNYKNQEVFLPASTHSLYERFGTDKPMGEIRLAEGSLQVVSETGRQLMLEFQSYSDTIATANMACSLAMNVPEITAKSEQIVESARKLQPPIPTETQCFFCPLTLQTEDENGWDLVEADPGVLVYHEDEIREALRAEISDGENMADYLRDETLKQKVASAEWDVARIGGVLYGCIRCELRAPLTEDEQAALTDWIVGQNSDGLGEGFEQHPIDTDDGNLYISFWHGGDDYYLLPEDEFRAQVLEQDVLLDEIVEDQGFGGMTMQ